MDLDVNCLLLPPLSLIIFVNSHTQAQNSALIPDSPSWFRFRGQIKQLRLTSAIPLLKGDQLVVLQLLEPLLGLSRHVCDPFPVWTKTQRAFERRDHWSRTCACVLNKAHQNIGRWSMQHDGGWPETLGELVNKQESGNGCGQPVPCSGAKSHGP